MTLAAIGGTIAITVAAFLTLILALAIKKYFCLRLVEVVDLAFNVNVMF